MDTMNALFVMNSQAASDAELALEPQPETETRDHFKIPEENYLRLVDRIHKLSRRSQKLGLGPINIVELGTEFETKRVRDKFLDPTGTLDIFIDQIFKYYHIKIDGQRPIIAGWQFVATLQHTDGGNLLRVVPGHTEPLPERYRNSDNFCEHCRTDRQRKDVYVLRHENGTYKQVGRTCLKDFMGHANPYAVAELAEMLATIDDMCRGAEDDDWLGCGSGSPRYFSIENFLTTVATVVRQDGWMSRTTARATFGGATASADTALFLLMPSLNETDRKAKAKYLGTVEDRAQAVAAIEWARNIAVDPENDFMWNLRVMAHMEVVDHKTSGIAAAIIRCYIVGMERELRYKKRMKEASESEFFGTPKKREEFTLTLRDVIACDGTWPSMLHRWITAEGNLAVWFQSGGSESGEFEVGQTYKVKATVKDHETYKGIKQTALTRLKLVEKVVESETSQAA